MRYATFNVLADAYIGYGDYSRVEPELLRPGARTQKLVQLVDSLEADVVGLQEVEEPVALSLLAVRGLAARRVARSFDEAFLLIVR